MSRTVALVTLITGLLAFLSGCHRSPPVPSTSAEQPRSSPEAGWDEQIAALRQGTTSEIRVAAQPVTAEQWNALSEGCEQLAGLDVETVDVPPQSLSLLAELPNLRRLRIGSPVGDAELEHVAQVDSLQVLNLPQGEFTDEGLAELAALPRLELLRFHSPHVTDAGMQHVSRLHTLRFLHLIDVPITDAGLTPLHAMRGLESFYLDGGNCTDEGLSRLLTELPELHFHLDQLHLPDDPHAHPH